MKEMRWKDLPNLRGKVQQVSFTAGARIFEEGDVGNGIYLIEKGSVELRITCEGKESQLRILDKDAIFGEMSIINDCPRMASAVALEPTNCLFVPRVEVERRLEKLEIADILLHKILSILCYEVRDYSRSLVETRRLLERHLEKK